MTGWLFFEMSQWKMKILFVFKLEYLFGDFIQIGCQIVHVTNNNTLSEYVSFVEVIKIYFLKNNHVSQLKSVWPHRSDAVENHGLVE